jgi:GNAT superfamily N-acetyltransferase
MAQTPEMQLAACSGYSGRRISHGRFHAASSHYPAGRVQEQTGNVTSAVAQYTTRLLTPGTWDDFAALVEANNGVWGGCWCIGFHPEGISKDSTVAGNRAAKLAHVNHGTVRQMLVYRDGRCVGWCQYGPPAEVATIKNRKAYEKDLAELPDWRIGCLFTGSGSRRSGVARAAVAAALAAMAEAGGGLAEAYPEQVADRDPQPGAYLHTGPESLFEEFGFVRDRRIAKWRWVMRLRIPPGGSVRPEPG